VTETAYYVHIVLISFRDSGTKVLYGVTAPPDLWIGGQRGADALT